MDTLTVITQVVLVGGALGVWAYIIWSAVHEPSMFDEDKEDAR